MHPPVPDPQYQLDPPVRLACGHAAVLQLLFHFFRRQPILQQTDDPARLFLLLEDVAATTAQQPVENGHGPVTDAFSASSVSPTSTATRHAPSMVFRQIVT